MHIILHQIAILVLFFVSFEQRPLRSTQFSWLALRFFQLQVCHSLGNFLFRRGGIQTLLRQAPAEGTFQVHLPQHCGVEQRYLLLLVQGPPVRNIALLINGNTMADGQKDVQQGLVLPWLVDRGAQRLNEPGASLATTETIMIPKRGLQLKSV